MTQVGKHCNAVEQLDRPHLNKQIYRILRRKILCRYWKGGEQLNPVKIAQGLGVSATPVKDAISRLASERFVEVVPQRGSFVAKIGPQDLVNRYNIRLMFELWACREGMTALSDEVLQRMRMIWVSAGELVDAARGGEMDMDAFAAQDVAFHRLIIGLPGNPLLVAGYESLGWIGQIARVNRAAPASEFAAAHREHGRILRGFETGDEPSVVHAVAFHLENSRSRTLAMLATEGGTL